MEWKKFRGEHPVFVCNLCSKKFTFGGFEHERLVIPSNPEVGTMSIIACTSNCRKQIDKYPPRIIQSWFGDLSLKAIHQYNNRDLGEKLKAKNEFLNIVKSSLDNLGLKTHDVIDN
jgi:hypothetical protein